MNGFKAICLLLLAILSMAVIMDLASEDSDAGVTYVDKGFEYRILNSNYAYSDAELVEYMGHESSVTVPNKVSTHNVRMVAERTFGNRSELTKVYIEDGISILGCILYGCHNIKEIHIPYSVTKIMTLSASPTYTFQTLNGDDLPLDKLRGYTYKWDGIAGSHNLIRVDSSYDGPFPPEEDTSSSTSSDSDLGIPMMAASFGVGILCTLLAVWVFKRRV